VADKKGPGSDKQLAFFDRAKAKKRGRKRTPALKASR
jgi:hypothetical protein